MNNGILDASSVPRLLPSSGQITHYIKDQLLLHAEQHAPRGMRLDSRTILVNAETELAHVLQGVIEERRPGLAWRGAFAQITEPPAGIESIVAREMTGGGQMKPIAAGASDMPLVHESGKPFSLYNVPHALGAEYTYQELLKAALYGMPLQARKLSLVRRGYEERVEQVAWFGDADHNLQGFFRNKRVKMVQLTKRGSNEPLVIDGSDTSVTASQIVNGLLDFINAVADDSNDAHMASVLTVAPKAYRHLSQTHMDETNRITIAEELNRKAGITLQMAQTFKNASGSKVGLDSAKTYQMVALTSTDQEQMGIILPHPHQFFAAQNRGMSVCIPSYAEIADVLIRSPEANRAAYYESA